MTTPNEARPEWEPIAWIRRDHLRHAQKAAFYCALSATQLQPDQDPLYGPAVHTEMLRAQEEARVLREALEEAHALNVNWAATAEPEHLLHLSEHKAVIAMGESALKGTP